MPAEPAIYFAYKLTLVVTGQSIPGHVSTVEQSHLHYSVLSPQASNYNHFTGAMAYSGKSVSDNHVYKNNSPVSQHQHQNIAQPTILHVHFHYSLISDWC